MCQPLWRSILRTPNRKLFVRVGPSQLQPHHLPEHELGPETQLGAPRRLELGRRLWCCQVATRFNSHTNPNEWERHHLESEDRFAPLRVVRCLSWWRSVLE